MPKQEQSIAINNLETDTALALAYEAMKKLNWTIQFAGDEKISANTAKGWNTQGQHIVFGKVDDQFMITSEMTHGQMFDFVGRNKKNIAAFTQAFETAKSSTDNETIAHNMQVIDNVRELTIKTIEDQEQKAAEVDAAMNLSGSNLYATYAIIGINVLVFVLMALDGAGIFEANGYVHLRWGSNFGPLTLSGDYWRLLTNTFIHFGIIHLAMNMYCLYTIGVYLEPMLGKAKYIAAYLGTGVLASVTSLWWHNDVNSAGASGAVFGLYGLFLALLISNLIPKHLREPLLKSIGIFIVFNLVYGLKSGVDNSAHIGGLVSGFIFGFLYVAAIKAEKNKRKASWAVPIVVLATVFATAVFLNNNKSSAEKRAAVLSEIKAASYKDNEKYDSTYNEILVIQEEANTLLKSEILTQDKLDQAGSLWVKIDGKLNLLKGYDVSENKKIKVAKFREYSALKKNELKIRARMLTEQNPDDSIPALNEVVNSINAVVAEIQKL